MESPNSRLASLVSPALILATLLASGCAGESRRTVLESGPREAEASWRRLPVRSAGVEARGGIQEITVETRVPSEDWKVEIRPLPVSEEGTVEFEVVGCPPAGSDGDRSVSQDFKVSHLVYWAEEPERILVYGSDGAVFAR